MPPTETSEVQAQERRIADAPEWTVVERMNATGGDPDRSIGECDQCNALLYAELWRIKNNVTGRTWTVGSTCVKKLTGMTPGQIYRAGAEHAAAEAADFEERERRTNITRFCAAHADELAWLDAHLERIHAFNDAETKKWNSQKQEGVLEEDKNGTVRAVGFRFPKQVSTEFWESLVQQAAQRGVWTEPQAEALHREMALVRDAELPAVKSKDVFAGAIINIRLVAPFRDRNPPDVQVELRADDGRVWVIKIASNTGFMDAIYAAMGSPAHTQSRAEKIYNGLNHFGYMAVRGTCKAHANLGGKAYLTRCSLVELRPR